MSQQKSSYELRSTMQVDVGMGTSPANSVIVGGIARATPYFGHGTDLALAARVATQSYVTGGFGLALDGGGFVRWWGADSTGFLTSLQVGAPFGVVLSLNASFGSDNNTTYGAVLGIDLARLTVFRLAGESQWPNVRPAWRPAKEAK